MLSEVEAVAKLARGHPDDNSLGWHWVVLAQCLMRNNLITVFLKQVMQRMSRAIRCAAERFEGVPGI